MTGMFNVTYQGLTVGTAHISAEGLYYRIICRCGILDGGIHRLYAGNENLGVLIPDRGELVLNTKVAAKRLVEGCVFSLDGQAESFIPICSGEAFAHLDKLRTAKLAFRNGEMGLRLGG